MKETVNLIAATVAVAIAAGLGWVAMKLSEPEPIEKMAPAPASAPVPSIPVYRVESPLLTKWFRAPPRVVASMSLPDDLEKDLELQCELLVIVTGLAQSNGTEEGLLSLEDARAQWALFEKDTLPVLNTFIEGNATHSWSPSDKGSFKAEITNTDTLYLEVDIADRKLFLPLKPPGDPRLGLTLAKLSN